MVKFDKTKSSIHFALSKATQPLLRKKMAPYPDLSSLGALKTEARSELAHSMDSLDTLGLCKAFNDEEAKVSPAVACSLSIIASLIDELVPRLSEGGRLIYVGAGNSGRVGFMDCSELPVTFSTDEKQFLTVVAGGDEAILKAKEGAEDSEGDGSAKLELLRLTSHDTVVGISASGRTPFVVGAIKIAQKYGAATAIITNSSPSILENLGVKYPIPVLVGPEFIAGSTRLKAGSAAKQILNMISTCTMIRMGKTYMGLMIDVRANNQKLLARGRRIIRLVCASISENNFTSSKHVDWEERVLDDDSLDEIIEQCGGNVKRACAVVISRLPPDCAQQHLDIARGNFRQFFQNISSCRTIKRKVESTRNSEQFFMSIDGGGTKCAVSICAGSSVLARARAGPCNFQSMKVEDLMAEIEAAVLDAISQIPTHYRNVLDEMPRFTTVWAGIAGVHHTNHREALIARLEKFLKVSTSTGSLILTSDSALLGACVGIDGTVDTGIALIAGTGSVAAAFKRDPRGEMLQVGRTGGWGPLLGDKGSAFDVGKQALQALFASIESSQGDDDYCLSNLESQILARIGQDKDHLLYHILYSDSQPRHLVGGLAKVVTELGFRARNPDPEALDILTSAARSLSKLVLPLARRRTCDPNESRLVLSGALLNIPQFKILVLNELSHQKIGPFKEVLIVDDVATYAVKFLQSRYLYHNLHQSDDREP